MNGPSRTQIQRAFGTYTGPAPTIGAAPLGGGTAGPAPSPSYQVTLEAKRARDAEANRERQARYRAEGRRRQAAAMKPRSRREAIGRATNGGISLNGAGGGAVATNGGAQPAWMNPWIWAAALGALWLLNRNRKRS